MRVTSSAILTALLAVAGAVLPADAQDIPRHLEGGESNFYQNSVELALAPDNPMVSEIRSGLDTLDPRVGIEIALDIPVAERAFSPEGLLEVYNILRSVSSMEGIEYYQRYQQAILLLLIKVSFVGCALTNLAKLLSTGRNTNSVVRRHSASLYCVLGLVVAAANLAWLCQKLPTHFLLYYTAPVFVWAKLGHYLLTRTSAANRSIGEVV